MNYMDYLALWINILFFIALYFTNKRITTQGERTVEAIETQLKLTVAAVESQLDLIKTIFDRLDRLEQPPILPGGTNESN